MIPTPESCSVAEVSMDSNTNGGWKIVPYLLYELMHSTWEMEECPPTSFSGYSVCKARAV